MEVLPELLSHEDGDGAHVGRHADDGYHEEERREHPNAAILVLFAAFCSVSQGQFIGAAPTIGSER